MRRQWFACMLVETSRLVQQQFRQATGTQPRKATVVVDASKRKAPITLQTIPADEGRVNRDPSHRLHRISRERVNMSDVNNHGPQLCHEPAANDKLRCVISEKFSSAAPASPPDVRQGSALPEA